MNWKVTVNTFQPNFNPWIKKMKVNENGDGNHRPGLYVVHQQRRKTIRKPSVSTREEQTYVLMAEWFTAQRVQEGLVCRCWAGIGGMALTSDPMSIIKRRWDCLSTIIKRIRLVEGMPGEVAVIAPWRDGFPPRNRVFGISWRERRSWCGRSTNYWRLHQSEVTIMGPRFEVSNFKP